MQDEEIKEETKTSDLPQP
jgi:hypothetical protein